MAADVMRAIIRDQASARLTLMPHPVRPSGWVRLRVLLAGICRTDLYTAEGLLPVDEPRVLGHELVGVVDETDPGSAFTLGTRVTVSPLLPGQRMLGVDIDGAFAEQVVVPAACVFPVPEQLPLRRAAYVEPVAASLAVVRAPIRPDQHGAVLGTGRIAALTARILEARGFRQVTRLDQTSNAEKEAFDFVVETGASLLDAALQAVRPGGVVVLKSRPPRPAQFDLTRAVLKDVMLAAVSYGSFPEAVALAAELPIDDLLSDIYPLDRFQAAFARAADDAGSPKLFLSPSDEA